MVIVDDEVRANVKKTEVEVYIHLDHFLIGVILEEEESDNNDNKQAEVKNDRRKKRVLEDTGKKIVKEGMEGIELEM